MLVYNSFVSGPETCLLSVAHEPIRIESFHLHPTASLAVTINFIQQAAECNDKKGCDQHLPISQMLWWIEQKHRCWLHHRTPCYSCCCFASSPHIVLIVHWKRSIMDAGIWYLLWLLCVISHTQIIFWERERERVTHSALLWALRACHYVAVSHWFPFKAVWMVNSVPKKGFSIDFLRNDFLGTKKARKIIDEFLLICSI